MSTVSSPVAIIGAGPAGALLAYLLASRGIDTLLIERQTDFAREFRGEVLMPSGARALEATGFDLDSVSTSTPRIAQSFLDGEPFLEFPMDTARASLPRAVSQPELLESLVERAQQTGHFELRRGTTVRGIQRQESGRIELQIRDETGLGRLEAGYVIGADGRGSASRRALAPRVLPRSAPLDIVWFKLPYPENWPEPRVRFEMGRGRLLIVIHSPDGQLQMGWVLLKGAYGDLKSRSIHDWVDAMRPYADPELSDHLARHRDSISRPFLLHAIADRVVGWSSPGMLLIGDAAHTMSPVGGQGINLALRDAIVAANELVPALTGHQDVDAAARRVEALRAPEIDRIQRLQSLPPRIVMGRTRLHGLVRHALTRALARPAARSHAGRVLSLFFDGVTEVELRV